MFVMPDPESVIQLPWKPEVAWVAGDPWMDGAPVAQAPRIVLKGLIEKAAKKNMKLMAGVEPEFHLISPDGSAISDGRDTQEKPCYDQSAVMRRFDVIADICSSMIKLGWGPYQNDHEDANGQFEINWNFNDSLTTADQLSFFKFMVKSLAEKHGLRATFMPKPFVNLTGNGCHVHISVWDNARKKNLFHDGKGELGLSGLCYQFLGGLMHHAESLAAITNPTVNSYKRINAPRTTSGATWSPSSITFGGNNRTHMVRVPDEGRIELRLPDGAANPYLMMSVILAAGLHGLDEKMDPGKRLDIDMYAEGHKVKGAKKLPLNLLDAIRNFDRDRYLKSALGDDFSAAYIKLKTAEWNQYCRHLTEWERQTTLDC
jgi:glutamine synthetase